MRIGHNYQAEIPQFIAYAPAPAYYEDEKAIRVWSPHNKIPDHVLDEFLTKAKDKFFYNTEQALGMLSWHKFDLNRAYADLPNFVPYPNEWSVEDKVLFEQAYQFHEKQFNKIKQMLPDKSMASLINYYYAWKKTRTRASLMERQTRRFAAKKNAGSNENSDAESGDGDDMDDEAGVKSDVKEAAQDDMDNQGCREPCCDPSVSDEPRVYCCVCNGELRNHSQNNCNIIDLIFENFCERCYLDWRIGGKKVVSEVESGDCFYTPSTDLSKRQILFTYSDVITLVEGAPEQGDLMLKYLDSHIQDRRREIQTKKQTLSQINEKIQPIADQIADLNMDEFSDILPEYKPVKNWTSEETQLVIQGLRRYGTDFTAISDVVRTKSPEAIKVFYVAQKERLGLGVLVNEFETTLENSAMPKPLVSQANTNSIISGQQT
uniref:REST corepressor 3 n=1 Tax=Aceria tosichella TaxID=561515 RepID=A0A6G1SJ08_9ACAR